MTESSAPPPSLTPAAAPAAAATLPPSTASAAAAASATPAASTSGRAGGSVSVNRASMHRLMGDLREMKTSPPEGCSAAPISDENLFVWNASIVGPDDSPWEGGVYSLRITMPDTYPSKPPKIRFTCEMFHPNIYSDGTLCLDLIQDNWSPIYTVASLLTATQSLLTDPNPKSPANPEAAKLLSENIKEYRRRVRRVATRSIES